MLSKKEDTEELKTTRIFANVILEFSSGIFVGIVIGYFIDKYFETKPIFILIFLFLGFFSGIVNVYRYIKKYL